ncbi:hypothetical protein ABW19_dt0209978 [Dactylella cylindrospora]|nr:hypothetical protein ABW19_dt0209978 [Dactylella cylindrospora]
MQLSKKQILVILAFAGAAVATPLTARTVSYKGTKVVRLDVLTKDESNLVKSIVDTLGLDTWTHSYDVNNHVDVVVPPSIQTKFHKLLEGTGVHEEIMHEDLEAAIEAESNLSHLPSSYKFNAQAAPDPNWYQAYHAYNDHLSYLQALVATYPNNAEIVTSGKSTEGREITGIHIWGKKKGKEAAVLHGTVHAREWISAKVVEYFALQLLQGAGNGTAAATVDKYDYYIFPVVNPDGFVYSQTNDRMWRKNRLKSSSSSCVGTDINRNWDYKWGAGGGASTSPCAQDYQGVSAGNTAEYKGLEAFLNNLVKTTGVKLYIDYHSYSQMILSPWGYTCDILPQEVDEHMRIMTAWEAASRKRYGTKWTFGPACQTIYATTGDSTDYTYGALNITHSYGVELRDTGRYGFLLPANQIVPSAEEAWDGFKVLIAELK